MPHARWDDQEEDDELDNEYPDEPDDSDDDEELDYERCQECGAEVYEEAEQCPYCDAYILHDHSVWSGRAWWWKALGLLGILVLILSLIGLSF